MQAVELPKSKIEFSWRKIDESLRSADLEGKDEANDIVVEVDEDEEEDAEAATENDQEKTEPEKFSSKMPWILESALENLGVQKKSLIPASLALAVRLESLQVLAAMWPHYLLLKDHLQPISTALWICLSDSSFDEKYHASRALELIGSAMNNFLSQGILIENIFKSFNYHKHLAESKTPEDAECSILFWTRLLPTIFENMQDLNQSPTLRAALADALSNIGVHNYEKLFSTNQIKLKSILTGCCYDDDPNVKSSAIRALSLYVLFPSLRKDMCFLENTIDSVLRLMKDKTLLLRVKASFALANVVDGLLVMRNQKVFITDSLQLQITETCLDAANDNDRVKVNVSRALGICILILNEEQLKMDVWQNIFEKSIAALSRLLTSSSSVKVKWNVCHAFGMILKNLKIYEGDMSKKWQPTVYGQLNRVIENSPNFKVRTNACIALMTPKERSHYDDYFAENWNSLLVALEQSNNLADFNEYKHRDVLQDQLCLAINHFLGLARVGDMHPMRKFLFPLIDITKQNWGRVLSRLPPEQQSSVQCNINSLESLKLECKNSEQKNSHDILLDCFKTVDQFV